MTCYVKPMIALSAIDRENRRAAATGSVRYAAAAADAGYNGHPVMMSFRALAVGGARWCAEYTWAGRRVVGRGSFEETLRGALREYGRGHRGALVTVSLDEDAPEPMAQQIAACEREGLIRVPDDATSAFQHAVSLAQTGDSDIETANSADR